MDQFAGREYEESKNPTNDQDNCNKVKHGDEFKLLSKVTFLYTAKIGHIQCQLFRVIIFYGWGEFSAISKTVQYILLPLTNTLIKEGFLFHALLFPY